MRRFNLHFNLRFDQGVPSPSKEGFSSVGLVVWPLLGGKGEGCCSVTRTYKYMLHHVMPAQLVRVQVKASVLVYMQLCLLGTTGNLLQAGQYMTRSS